MGKKIFVSYKFSDGSVGCLDGNWDTSVRDYVNKLEDLFDSSDHIYKGESDDEDLSYLSDDTIWARLKDRIYDSTITIVLISPQMRQDHQEDRRQWIPWEISYSLKQPTRNDRTSRSNAVFAVVLPDARNSYDYFIEDNACCSSSCRTLKTDRLFSILRGNMFNQKQPDRRQCEDGRVVFRGESSYIFSVKWTDFVVNVQGEIDRAINLQSNIDKYDIQKEV